MTQLAPLKVVTASLNLLKDRVLIKCDPEQTQVGSIIVPSPVDTEILKGTVVSIGPGKWTPYVFIPTTLKPGDRVYYRRPLSDKLEEDGQRYALTNEDEIIAKIEE
jgi:co-chaperonin GroES (HSP10)